MRREKEEMRKEREEMRRGYRNEEEEEIKTRVHGNEEWVWS